MVGKCKFHRGEVVHYGDRFSATSYMREHGLPGKSIVGGTATAGDMGTIIIRYWDPKKETYRAACSVIGEGGLKPGGKYKVDEKGKFQEVAE